jgi:hypothetical protein
LFYGILTYSQNPAYPFKIKQGEKQSVEPTEFDVWVLKSSQFDSALAYTKRYEVAKEKIITIESKVSILQNENKEKDELVNTLKKDRDFYQTNWKKTETDLSEVGKMAKQEMRKKNIYRLATFIGIPVAFIIGLIL